MNIMFLNDASADKGTFTQELTKVGSEAGFRR